jgi:predicted dehydrogenase
MPLARRSFIAAPALAAAQKNVETIALPRMVRCGVLGTGGHNSLLYAVLPQVAGLTITAVADDSESRLDRARKSPHHRSANFYKSWREMLDREKLDMVLLGNDNGARSGALLACAARGLHCLSEKPVALTLPDLDKVASAFADTGAKPRLGCLLKIRTEPWALAIRDMVQSGLLGEIIHIDTQKSYKYASQDDWKKSKATFGGTIQWIGVDMIDLMLWVSGRRFTPVGANQTHIGLDRELGAMENTAAALFRMDNGGTATVRLDYLRTPKAPTHGDDRLRVAGTSGIAEWSAATGLSLQTAANEPSVVRQLPAEKSVGLEFLKSTFLGGRPFVTHEEIVNATRTTLLAASLARQS